MPLCQQSVFNASARVFVSTVEAGGQAFVVFPVDEGGRDLLGPQDALRFAEAIRGPVADVFRYASLGRAESLPCYADLPYVFNEFLMDKSLPQFPLHQEPRNHLRPYLSDEVPPGQVACRKAHPLRKKGREPWSRSSVLG